MAREQKGKSSYPLGRYPTHASRSGDSASVLPGAALSLLYAHAVLSRATNKLFPTMEFTPLDIKWQACIMGQMGLQPFKRDALQVRVIDLYKQGLTFREVSKQLKISHETARQLWLSGTVDKVSLTQTDKASTLKLDSQ